MPAQKFHSDSLCGLWGLRSSEWQHISMFHALIWHMAYAGRENTTCGRFRCRPIGPWLIRLTVAWEHNVERLTNDLRSVKLL